MRAISMLAAVVWSAMGLSLNAATDGYFDLKSPWKNMGSSTPSPRPPKMRGLVPGGSPVPLEVKVKNAMEQLRGKASPLEQYTYLHTIQDADEVLYYAIIAAHTAEVMPIVYTPTVGTACTKWGEIHRGVPRGIYLTIDDLGDVESILRNHPLDDVEVIVFTDGERILGLGDQGCHGMGIPIGKLALYTACAGVEPSKCLPISLDVGTNNEALRESDTYLGLKRPRDRSERYDALVKEVFDAAQSLYGKNVLMQFEDFGNSNAFRLLDEYKDKACCFNDDIQGTAAVVVAGLIASLKITGGTLLDQKFMFLGAGEAGVGIADLLSEAIAAESGCDRETARRQILLLDSQGLVTAARHGLAAHKRPYAHDVPGAATLLDAVREHKPTAIIGVSAQPATFTTPVLEAMAAYNDRPVVFALSNPTSKAECTAAEAYAATGGKCVFASVEIKSSSELQFEVFRTGLAM